MAVASVCIRGAARAIEVAAHETAHHAGADEREAKLFGRVALARAIQAEQQRTRTRVTPTQRF